MDRQARVRAILSEIERVLEGVDQTEVDDLLEALLASATIVVYGLGREGLAMRSFAMRLMHLGLDVAVVGDMTTPPVGPGDLFLVSCGPGYLSTVAALQQVAHEAGASVFMLTAEPDAALAQRANARLVLPAQTMAKPEAATSEQAMGSAFEQALWILFDVLVPELQQRLGESADNLRNRHTNLE